MIMIIIFVVVAIIICICSIMVLRERRKNTITLNRNLSNMSIEVALSETDMKRVSKIIPIKTENKTENKVNTNEVVSSNEWQCGKCFRSNAIGYKFCPNCGEKRIALIEVDNDEDDE